MKKETRNTIKRTVKLTFINVAILIGSALILYLIFIAFITSILNAIFRNADDSMYAVNVLLRICFPVVTALTMCIPHARNATARREFLNILGADKYNRKEDFLKLAKTKDFLIECILFAVLYVVAFFIPQPPQWIFLTATLVFPFGSLWNDAGILFMANPPQWIYLVAILVFPVANLWHHTALHKKWASERLHLGNPSVDNTESKK